MAILDLLLLVLAMVMARAVWRVIDGVMEGLSGRGRPTQGGNVPARGVQMVRDPVCGTYVIPDRAVALSDGTGRVFFCSPNCRDQYRARPSTRSASSGSTASEVEPPTSRSA
jgi:uncharacterized protein